MPDLIRKVPSGKTAAIPVEIVAAVVSSLVKATQGNNKLPTEKVDMQKPDHRRSIPQPQGFYHPRNEHDACGMGLVASIRGEKSHEIIRKGSRFSSTSPIAVRRGAIRRLATAPAF